MKYLLVILFLISCDTLTKEVGQHRFFQEKHRPQIHFSPKANWMNDPNGMIFHNGVYHLFFQYYPDSTVWGPMHWGHATSKDLVHWNEEKIALYPDSLGYIFSGSAVFDVNNSSGFGKDGVAPLVAIFTFHDTAGEKAGKNDYQTQGLAYSLDDGRNWIKYDNNPVLANPGIKDFRDPKVMWYEEGKKWIMTLATKDRISFYSSPDLKNWTKESEFGEKVGAHGGVWECPDLFPVKHNGGTIWVLFVSINPGGPNGGSATQYFTGNFDGKNFIPFQTDTRWLDYGPDNYAGVTWSNVGGRKLFLGWMGNWQYAQVVPTEPWRSAMTVPRDIGVKKVGDRFMLTSGPVKELDSLNEKIFNLDSIDAPGFDLTAKTERLHGPGRIKFNSEKIENFTISLSNNLGEKLVIGYEKEGNRYFIDRSKSGVIDFENGFGVKHTAQRISRVNTMDMEIIIDNASVEVFADGGLSVMTAIYFPDKPYSYIQFESASGFKIDSLQFCKMKGIWD